MSASSNFSARVVDGVHVVELSRTDVLDTSYITRVQQELLAYAAEKHGASMVVDLSSVKFLSSTALGLLLALHQALSRADGTLAVAGADDEVLRAFKLVKLHKVVGVHDTVREAVDAALKKR
ncbi:MAG: STAS domain-containing protein [Phycisphaerales bacterium]|nr:STAS domain-containing protein [Phycisphaerales bacterium]